MIGSAQSAHLVDSVILSRHTACLAPPNVAILRMYTSSESHFLLPAKRLALRMVLREAFKNYLADFVPPPSYPLNGKSFCQKTLSGKGGYIPPLNGKSQNKLLKKWVKKG